MRWSRISSRGPSRQTTQTVQLGGHERGRPPHHARDGCRSHGAFRAIPPSSSRWSSNCSLRSATRGARTRSCNIASTSSCGDSTARALNASTPISLCSFPTPSRRWPQNPRKPATRPHPNPSRARPRENVSPPRPQGLAQEPPSRASGLRVDRSRAPLPGVRRDSSPDQCRGHERRRPPHHARDPGRSHGGAARRSRHPPADGPRTARRAPRHATPERGVATPPRPPPAANLRPTHRTLRPQSAPAHSRRLRAGGPGGLGTGQRGPTRARAGHGPQEDNRAPTAAGPCPRTSGACLGSTS